MPQKYNYITRHFICKKVDNKIVVLFECNTEESAKKEVRRWKNKGYFYKPKKEKIKRIEPASKMLNKKTSKR